MQNNLGLKCASVDLKQYHKEVSLLDQATVSITEQFDITVTEYFGTNCISLVLSVTHASHHYAEQNFKKM